MLPSSFRRRVLVAADPLDAGCAPTVSNYKQADAQIVPLATLFEQLDGLEEEKLDSVCVLSSKPEGLADALTIGGMSKCFRVLAKGGSLNIQCVVPSDRLKDYVDSVLMKISSYAGFMEGNVMSASPISTLPNYHAVKFVCKRPDWSFGAPSAVALASLALDDLGKEGEFIDEKSLIDEGAPLDYAALGKGVEGCASKPRACANCSCGRKELEVAVGAEEAKKRLEGGAVRSSCGSVSQLLRLHAGVGLSPFFIIPSSCRFPAALVWPGGARLFIAGVRLGLTIAAEHCFF
eukprot:GHVT01047968.1.p1 GENE.GHVT01047968.1~~GHVT01047968.1.p1  ORF type:complete len:291 (-),score=54.68 GHVT01047968.1:158-1030(-)